MKGILVAIVLALSLLLIPTNISSVSASDNYTFEKFILEIEVLPPVVSPSGSSGGGGGGGGGDVGIVYGIQTDLFGVEKKYYTGYDGGISQTVEATSEDGRLTVTIPKGTAILDEKGRQLRTLEVVIDETPPLPPEDTNIIGLPYDFSPAGATFEPPITFTWSYDPDTLPEGVTEDNLVLAYYIDGEWIELECVVNPDNNTITASVSHFTTFAIIGTFTPVSEPIIEPELAPVVVPSPVAPIAPTLAVVPTPLPTSPEQPLPPPSPVIPIPEAEEGLSGIALAGIIFGLTLAVVGIIFIVKRRKRKIWAE